MGLRNLIRSNEERAVSYQALWGRGYDLTANTWSGGHVSYDTAFTVSTLYACVRLLADDISTLPVDTFFRYNGERLPFRPKPAWVDEPDAGVTRSDHLQQVMVSLLLDGNAYVRVYRDPMGDPVALVVLDPKRVTPQRSATGDIEYAWDMGNAVIPRRDMLHVTILRRPGALKGVNPLDEVKQSLGLATALDEFAGRFFSGGSTVSGVLQTPAVLSKEQATEVKDAFEATHRGNRNSHRVAVLGGGSTFQKTSVDPENAQMLESRRFAVEEIARIFRVPLHMLQASAPGVQSYASNEQNEIQYISHTLRPIVTKLEAAYSTLLPGGGFVKFNLDGLQRGDIATRSSYYSTGLQAGWLSIADVRRLEDLRPVDGGDVVRVPLANVNLAAADLVEMDKRVAMASRLVTAGYDPAAVLAALDLPDIPHTGLPSTLLQPVQMVDPADPASVYPA